MRTTMNQRVRERNTVRLGIVGTVLAVLVTVVATNVSSLPILSASAAYSGVFRDTGGLVTGADVEVAGIVVGEVTDIEIDADTVVIAFTVGGGSNSTTMRAWPYRHRLCWARRI